MSDMWACVSLKASRGLNCHTRNATSECVNMRWSWSYEIAWTIHLSAVRLSGSLWKLWELPSWMDNSWLLKEPTWHHDSSWRTDKPQAYICSIVVAGQKLQIASKMNEITRTIFSNNIGPIISAYQEMEWSNHCISWLMFSSCLSPPARYGIGN